jgi:hypothetical protein
MSKKRKRVNTNPVGARTKKQDVFIRLVDKHGKKHEFDVTVKSGGSPDRIARDIIKKVQDRIKHTVQECQEIEWKEVFRVKRKQKPK